MTNPNEPVQTPRPVAGAPTPPAGSSAAPVQPVVVAAARKRGPLDYALAIAFVVAVGGVAFAVGRTTAPAQASTPNLGGFVPTGSFDPGTGGPGGGLGGGGLGGFGGGLTIEGTVTSIDGSTLVIETANGQEVTVDLDASTTYHEATATDADAVAAGDEVTVRAAGGGQFGPGGGANPGASGTPSFTATDVTVDR
ncbi:MAG: DUF5666 domain-containing protein [Chloroflexota bacterium]